MERAAPNWEAAVAEDWLGKRAAVRLPPATRGASALRMKGWMGSDTNSRTD